MRRDAFALMGSETDSESDTSAPEPREIKFHLPFDYVRRAYLYLSRGWGWPEEGGWGNQDARLIEDLDTFQYHFGLAEKDVRAGWKPRSSYEDIDESASEWQIGADQF